jgi:hypothetical protein
MPLILVITFRIEFYFIFSMILICFCLKNLLTDLSHFSVLIKECVNKWLQINVFKALNQKLQRHLLLQIQYQLFRQLIGRAKKQFKGLGHLRIIRKMLLKKSPGIRLNCQRHVIFCSFLSNKPY